MSGRIAAATLFVVALAALFSAPAGKASAAPDCKSVRGHITSRSATENCTSPINLCAEGQLYGAIRGEFFLVGTGLTPTQDTPATGTFSEAGGEFSYEGEVCTP
jgi:hypothetical protein